MIKKTMKITLITIFSYLVFSNSLLVGSEDEESRLIKRIKQQTAQDLKRIGIQKMLLGGEGHWFDGAGSFYQFTPDGRVFYTYKLKELGYFYWKVRNGVLYINPNNISFVYLANKFFPMIVEPSAPSGYSENIQGTLGLWKYALIMKSEDGKFAKFMNH